MRDLTHYIRSVHSYHSTYESRTVIPFYEHTGRNNWVHKPVVKPAIESQPLYFLHRSYHLKPQTQPIKVLPKSPTTLHISSLAEKLVVCYSAMSFSDYTFSDVPERFEEWEAEIEDWPSFNDCQKLHGAKETQN